jgi:inner membrane protein
MDLLTQGLLGAACAVSVARRPELRPALAIGFFAGMLADADVLIRSSSDPLLTLEYHRQFTHALLFIPFGAAFAALLCWLPARRRLQPRRIYLYAFFGYLPSGLLDAFTSYGTQLLWPFSDARIAWNAVSVVDPLFSLALVTGLLVGALRQRPAAARIGLAIALLYLGAGLLQRERAEAFAAEIAAARGHPVERLQAKPTLGNLLLWRIIYLSGGHFHVDAVRVPPWGASRHYPGGALPQFDPADLEALPADSLLRQDVERFAYFSDGYLAWHPQRPEVLGDVRYAMLPNDLQPLWAIEIDPARPDAHTPFLTFRSFSPDQRRAFMAMLLGRELH